MNALPRLLLVIPLVMMLTMVGCTATPGRLYLGQAPAVEVIDGREYRVWSRRAENGGQVQVVRMGYVPRSGHGGIRAAMVTAAERATGCAVVLHSVEGDTGVINARIRCPG